MIQKINAFVNKLASYRNKVRTIYLIMVMPTILLFVIIFNNYHGEIERYRNRKSINAYMNTLRTEKVEYIAVSQESYNYYELNLDSLPAKVISNKDSINVIVKGILNAKGYTYAHPNRNCNFTMRIYFANNRSLDCDVFNSSTCGTIFILYDFKKEKIGSFRNDELNEVICEFLSKQRIETDRTKESNDSNYW